MLEELTSALDEASRWTDSLADLCSRGEPVEPAIAQLVEQVSRIESLVAATGTGARRAIQELVSRIYDTIARIEAQKIAVGSELAALAQQDRVRRMYQHSPT